MSKTKKRKVEWPERPEQLRAEFEEKAKKLRAEFEGLKDKQGARLLADAVAAATGAIVFDDDAGTKAKAAESHPLLPSTVLDWAQRRMAELRLLAELRPAIDHPASTDAELRARFRALAKQAWRFMSATGEVNFRELLREARGSNRQSRDGRTSALPYPPELQWAEAIRDTATALRPHTKLDADRLERVIALEHAMRTALDIGNRRPVAIGSLVADVEKVIDLVEQMTQGKQEGRNPAARLVQDGVCIAIVLSLTPVPDGLRTKPLRAQVRTHMALRRAPSVTNETIKKRLSDMRKVGFIWQEKTRLPYKLTEGGRKAFADVLKGRTIEAIG